MRHIKNVFSEHTGGGIVIDFVELENGQVLGIGEGLICLYKNMDEFYNGEVIFSQEYNDTEGEA